MSVDPTNENVRAGLGGPAGDPVLGPIATPISAEPKIVRQRIAHCPVCRTRTNQSVHETYVDTRTRLTVSWQCLTCSYTISVVSAQQLRDRGLLAWQDVVPELVEPADDQANPLA